MTTTDYLKEFHAALANNDQLDPAAKQVVGNILNKLPAKPLSTPSGQPGTGDGVTVTPGSGVQWQEVVYDLEQTYNTYSNPDHTCAALLPGIAAAAKAGDNEGAANGMLAFLRCLHQPRTLLPGKINY